MTELTQRRVSGRFFVSERGLNVVVAEHISDQPQNHFQLVNY